MLGVQWNPKTDTIQYHVSLNNLKKISKHVVQIVQIFDSLGLLGPIIIIMKLLLQRLWRLNLNWDESVPQDIQETFLSVVRELEKCSFSISRYVLQNCELVYELHGFSDASESAYGACIYIRSICANRKISSKLLCAKSKIAPLKSTTLQYKVIKKIRLSFQSIHLYSDSAMSWIQSTFKRWKTVLANRVQLTSAKY